MIMLLKINLVVEYFIWTGIWWLSKFHVISRLNLAKAPVVQEWPETFILQAKELCTSFMEMLICVRMLRL